MSVKTSNLVLKMRPYLPLRFRRLQSIGAALISIHRANEALRSAVPVFHPEYGRYMLESTPGEPYNGSVNDLLSVECNMRFRWCNRHNAFRSIHSLTN